MVGFASQSQLRTKINFEKNSTKFVVPFCKFVVTYNFFDKYRDSPKGVAVLLRSMISISILKVVPPDGAIRDIIAEKVRFCSWTTGGALRLNTAAEGRARESELARL